MRVALPLRFPAAFAVLVAISATALACSGGVSSDELEALEREAALNAESARRAQVITALEPLNPLHYHHLDAIVRNEERIPSDAVIWATRAELVLGWVDWPHELRPHVEQYSEWLAALLAAMREDDAEAAAEPSRITHALAHTFEASVIAWLEGRSVPEPPELAGLEPPPHAGHEGMSDGQMESMQSDDEASDSSGHSEHE